MILGLVRRILSALILSWDALFPARPQLLRSKEEKARLEPELQRLVLYEFKACPFCLKVRRALKRMDLELELRDARRDERAAAELVSGGGELQVPCLKIQEEAGVRWLYESSDIIAYLEKRFGPPGPQALA